MQMYKKGVLFITALALLVFVGNASVGSNANDNRTITNALSFNANNDNANPSPDFDGDGTVGIPDFLLFVDHFGLSQSDTGYDARFDLDGDGSIGIGDFLAFMEAFGTTYPTGGEQGGDDSSVIPSSPANVRYQWAEGQYQISWEPSPNTTSYRVYYDNATAFAEVSCPGGCSEIVTVSNTTISHFEHREGERKIGYWVRACNDAGCSNYVRASRIGGDSSAPPPPSNVKYQWDRSISQYRISWEPSPNATSYRVYYDNATAFDVSCPGGCSEIVTVSNTTISHFRHSEGEIVGPLNLRRKIGYWVRACNDAGCSNYVRASRGENIGPDLIVESASVSNGSPNAGQSFTLSVTVSNQGNRQSSATMLRYYRSSDQKITQRDTEVGTDAVGSLSVSGVTSKSISLTASSSYYYGACVDAVNYDIDRSNECSSGVPIIVGGQPLSTITVIELDVSNRSSAGITYANDRLYVVDSFQNKVYAYMSSGQRDATSDFEISASIHWPEGITYANDRFYVVDDRRDKVYTYMSSGQRDATSDFEISADHTRLTGITYANDRFYVVDDQDDKVYAYMSSGQRDATSDFDLSSDKRNRSPMGITYANDRFYVVDIGGRVHAYMSSGQRDAASDFDLSSGHPTGITYANDRFYVVDRSRGKVYVFNP